MRPLLPHGEVVVDALAAHSAAFPTDDLVFLDERGQPIRRSQFGHLWRAAVEAAGAPNGLRHYYASLLIRHGESVKVVQAQLGHATAAETLDTYSHLWPDSDDRTWVAVDSVLGASSGALVVPSGRCESCSRR